MVFQIIFLLLAAWILGTALMVVVARNIVHAALWLIASFAGVGGLYLFLQAEFLAVVQILVYVGAVSILILFAIMLTRHITGTGEVVRYARWWVGLLVAVTLLAALLVPALVAHDWTPDVSGSLPRPATSTVSADQTERVATIVDIGQALVGEYLLAFEVAGIILLIGLVGAIVIAFGERSQRRIIPTLAEEFAQKLRQQ